VDADAMLAGRYRRLRILGAGAMGEVWLAHDQLLRRQVAVKQLLTGPEGNDPTRVERVMREARLAARLAHPNAVAVYDLVVEGGLPHVVMEYVPGPTLAERIGSAGRLDHDEARRLIGQVAAALEAAHTVGIVHRDVKPGNILISAHGTAKLADFGIARGAGDAALTQTGLVTGTPAYLAPEVARGAAPTSASDIWSLGATLFAALDGRPPYDDRPQNNLALLTRIVTEPVPPPRFAGRVRPVVEQMLSRDPGQRPAAGHVVSMLSAAETTTLNRATRVGTPVGVQQARTAQARPAAHPPVARPAAHPPVATTAPVPPVRAGGGRRWRAAALAGVTAAATAAVAVVIVAASHGGSSRARSDASGSTSARRPAASSPQTAASSVSADPMTASRMTSFVRNYYSLIPKDLPVAWTKLGPGLRAQGYDAYANWWSRFDAVTVTPTAADPARHTVTINLTARNASTGTVATDTELLTLVTTDDGASLLIDANTVL